MREAVLRIRWLMEVTCKLYMKVAERIRGYDIKHEGNPISTLLMFNLDGFTEQLCMILVFEYVWTNDS